MRAGVRVIQAAVLTGAGLVDSGAYAAATVEARAKARKAQIMAITLTSAALATAIKKPLEVAERLLPVASDPGETRYGPNAPTDAIQNEAVIRTSGWLVNQPASACSRDQVGLPDKGIAQVFAFRPSTWRALRGSGAMSLLSPWKVRRAGSIPGSGFRFPKRQTPFYRRVLQPITAFGSLVGKWTAVNRDQTGWNMLTRSPGSLRTWQRPCMMPSRKPAKGSMTSYSDPPQAQAYYRQGGASVSHV